MLWNRLRLTLDMIKFEHSVFALPFALTGALLAFRESGFHAPDLWRTLLWIVVAMVGARSAAMAFNRLVDSEIDARNPRTRMRHLPAGLLSRGFAWGFVIASSGVFFLAAWALNPLCLRLAPAGAGDRLLLFVHEAVHVLRPPGARASASGSRRPPRGSRSAARSIRGSSGSPPRSRSGRPASTSSTPARITISTAPRSCSASRASSGSRRRCGCRARCTSLMVVCLLALVHALHLGALALAGVAAIVALLLYEHSLVKANDLSRVNAAFFTMNGYVSVLFFVFWAADIFFLKPGA